MFMTSKRVHAVARDLYMPLDASRTHVSDDTGIVVVDAVPYCAVDDADVSASAFLVALQDEFTPAPVTLTFQNSAIASQRIRTHVDSVNDLARQTFVALATTAYDEVVDAYPWRHKGLLRSRAKMSVDHVRACLEARAGTPPVAFGVVDDVLPPVEDVLVDVADRAVFHGDIVALACTMPKTLLECYEVLFRAGVFLKAGCGAHLSLQSMRLFDAVFA